MKPACAIVVCLLASLCAGCTTATLPTEYAATLSTQDAKWNTPLCVSARAAASSYEEKRMNVATALVLGPYGLGLLAASREVQAKKRRTLAREMHLQCSSTPLPKELEPELLSANG